MRHYTFYSISWLTAMKTPNSNEPDTVRTPSTLKGPAAVPLESYVLLFSITFIFRSPLLQPTSSQRHNRVVCPRIASAVLTNIYSVLCTRRFENPLYSMFTQNASPKQILTTVLKVLWEIGRSHAIRCPLPLASLVARPLISTASQKLYTHKFMSCYAPDMHIINCSRKCRETEN